MLPTLSQKQQAEVAEVLDRRANEIAGFLTEYQRDAGHFGSVELALTREIDRLRDLAEKVCPPEPDEE